MSARACRRAYSADAGPGIPRDGGRLFRRMPAGVSQGDVTLVDVKVVRQPSRAVARLCFLATYDLGETNA